MGRLRVNSINSTSSKKEYEQSLKNYDYDIIQQSADRRRHGIVCQLSISSNINQVLALFLYHKKIKFPNPICGTKIKIWGTVCFCCLTVS